ncbi:MAG TPA: AbrB/MazE/SpoVT family DNA-binding domain-containing protein [Thermomicrobiales bacterium]|nr:AbrB/MazE/SpoVT family DNA-binding domain-containing protein [Thermomicrobiales bacterium]
MTSGKAATRLVRPLRGGQITIPIEFRRELGITDETMLQVTLEEDELRVRPVRVTDTAQGSPWLRELYEYFAPVRQEILERGIAEEELNADIDAAVAAVRAKRRASGT